MNRKHTVEQYVDVCDKILKNNPEVKFSSDFIVSYPGEEQCDFEDTINLIKKIKFINSFSFIFSPRPGTKAGEFKTIDNNISTIEASSLLWDFRDINFDNVNKLTVPTYNYKTESGAEVLILDDNFYNFIQSNNLLD